MSVPIIDRIQFTNETYYIRDNSVSWFSKLQSIWTIIGTDITDVQATIDSIIGGEPNGSGE